MRPSLRPKNVAGSPNRLTRFCFSQVVNSYCKVTFSIVVDNVKMHDRVLNCGFRETSRP